MARNLNDIQQSILDKKTASAELTVLEVLTTDEKSSIDNLTSASKVAIWRLWVFIVAFAIWTLEKLFDVYRIEVDGRIAQNEIHNFLWYKKKALEFQYGYNLVAESDRYDNTGLEIIIVRLPLVYGHGVKGNLRRLMKLIKFGIPLPFKRIQNYRSMMGIDNLVDFLISCIEHPNAAGKTFLVSDGEDLSTPDLVNHIASSMGHSPLLFPVPIQFLKFIGLITGKKKKR